MKYLIKESLYSELVPSANKITQKYLDFHKEYTERREKAIKVFDEELNAKDKSTQEELDRINDEYVQTIYECLVDIEDLYKNSIVPRLDFGMRSYYEAKVSDYPRFIEVQQKINDVIGEIAFNLEFKIGNDRSHNAIRYATKEFTNSDNVKTLEEFEEVIKGVDASERMTARFVFKPLSEWKPIKPIQNFELFDDDDGEEL